MQRIQPLYGNIKKFFGYVNDVHEELNQIRKLQYDTELLEKTGRDRYNELIAYSREHCPYYKKLFKEDIWKNYFKAPLLDKKILKSNLEDLCSDLIPIMDTFKRHTSGTTGIPTTMIYDSFAINYNWISLARRLEILDSSFVTGQRDTNFVSISDYENVNEWRGNLPIQGYPILTKLGLDNFGDDDKILDKLKYIISLKPKVIFGTPRSLLYFSEKLKKYHLDIPKPSIMMTSGEKLNDYVRNILENFFDTNVFNQYAITECGNIACECEYKSGLHIETNRAIVESNIKGKPVENTDGEIVITDLINKAMPIVRYRTGDFGTITYKRCKCGLVYPRMLGIKGRIVSYFQKEDGKMYNPIIIGRVLNRMGFKQYRLIQSTIKEIDLIYLSEDNGKYDKDKISKIIRDICGNVSVKIQEVKEFDNNSSKSNYLYSKLDNPFI